MSEEDFKAATEQFEELMPAWQGALSALFAATSPLAKAGRYYGPDGVNEFRGFPRPAIINEFVGIFFDILFAFFSKLAVLGLAATVDAVIAFVMVTVTYVMFRKLYPATYSRI